MIKYFSLLFCLTTTTMLYSQNIKPKYLSVSYFGETITHPGVKLGATYEIYTWQKLKMKRNETKKVTQKYIYISPSVGFFYHKDYQLGIFILPEFSYSRKNVKGNYFSFGIGTGYMETLVPNVYDLNPSGEIEKIQAGYNYLLTNCSINFGKDLNIKKDIPMHVFIKPQFMYASPNTPKGVWYFALETGIKYSLINRGVK